MAMAAIPIFSAAVGALLSSSLPKLYAAVANLEDPSGVEELDQELRHMNCRIKEILEKCKDMSGPQKALVETMRLLVYDIEDLIDSKDMFNQLKLSAMIKQIRGRVVAMQAHLESFNLEEAKSSSSASTSSSFSLGKSSHDAQQEEVRLQHLQGMEERVQDVLDLVRGSEITSSEKKLKVISIVGFGGTGKSLLARQVYNGVEDEYPMRTFVQAGQRDTEKVLEEIRKEFLRSKEELELLLVKQLEKKVIMGRSKSDDGGEHGRKGKAVVDSDSTDVAGTSSSQQPRRADEKEPRYLLVIDDLMEEQLGKRIISVLESIFAVEDRGSEEVMTVACTVLLTTSVLSVAEACRSDHVYKMRPLNDEESEKLFKHVAGIKELTVHEKELMEEIRMKCDGLPLALVTVAKFCGTNMVDRWKEAWRKLGCPNEEEDYDLARMQRVLDHSYTSLPSHPLQASLLYFCMFPHGHPVRKGSIIRRWLAEGPEVDCGTCAGGQPTDQLANAKRCFETLVGRNVIWPHQDDVKTWKAAGVILEYIKGMSGMLKFIMLSSPDNDKPEDIRRLSLHNTGVCDGGEVLCKNLSRLRTLAVFRKSDEEASLDFTKCDKLRLLDLEACSGLNDGHLNEICKRLHLLKYLSLGASTKITEVPRRILYLERLETLDIGKQRVVKVPAEVIMLPGLKHLLGKVELLTNYRLVRSDTKSNRLKRVLNESKLQTLAGFVIAESLGFPQLMHRLKSLKKVKIWCGHRVSQRNREDVVASIREFLARGVNMSEVPTSLSIDFQESTVAILDELVAGGDPPKNRSWWRRMSHQGTSLSERSHPADGAPSQQSARLGCLASLKLKGFAQLKTAPAFLSNLDFVYDLCLSSKVVTWKDLLVGVSNLHTLKSLEVVEVDGEDHGEDNISVLMQKDKLQRLERMCLVTNRKLPRFEIADGALETLISLHLASQHLVGEGSFRITFLTKLKEVALHYRVGSPEKEAAWKKVAREHRNTPQVILMELKTPNEEIEIPAVTIV